MADFGCFPAEDWAEEKLWLLLWPKKMMEVGYTWRRGLGQWLRMTC
jgi:hypothetical protein